MTALSIQPTFPTFTGADGQPLENGYIWVGTANLNPITNPITVYWDAALSAPATQPIRTLGGYPSNSGTPARLYVNSDYSIQVLDRKGSVVYSAPVATDRYGGGIINANIVVYDPSGTGAVATTMQAKGRQVVSINDFGASPSASASTNTTAINYAMSAASVLGQKITGVAGVYLVTPATSMTDAAGTVLVCFPMASNIHFDVDPGCTFKISNGVSSNGSPVAMGMFLGNSVYSNISFKNLTMDMNGANNRANNTLKNQAHISFSAAGGVQVRASNVLIDNCKFINTAGTNCIVMAQSSTVGTLMGSKWIVRNCLFDNNGLDVYDHTSIFGWANDVICTGNTFTADAMATSASGTGANGTITAYEIHGARHNFENNTIQNYLRGVYVASNLTSDCNDSIIANNIMSPVGVYGITFYREAVTEYPIYDITIDNNTIVVADTASPVTTKGPIQIGTAYAVYDIKISNNRLKSNHTVAGGSGVFGVYMFALAVAAQANTRVFVTNNQIIGCTVGVNLQTSATNPFGIVRVDGNQIINPTDGGPFTNSNGIIASGASTIDDLSLTSNTCSDLRGGSAYMENGILLTGAINNLYCKGNNSVGAITSKYTDSSATITTKRGDYEGTWTPVRVGFTEVIGAGSITNTGTFRRTEDSVTVTCEILAAGGATIAAVAGIGSYITGLPFIPSGYSSGTWADASNVAASGSIQVASGAGSIYIGTAWGAATHRWVMTITYPVATT